MCFEPHRQSCAPAGKLCWEWSRTFLAWGAEWFFFVPDMTGLEKHVGSLYIRSDISVVSWIRDYKRRAVGVNIFTVPPEYIRVRANGTAIGPDQHTHFCSWHRTRRCELDSTVMNLLTLVIITGKGSLPGFFQGPGGYSSGGGDTGGMKEAGEGAVNGGPNAGYRTHERAGYDASGNPRWNKFAQDGELSQRAIPGYWAALRYWMDPRHCGEEEEPKEYPEVPQPRDEHLRGRGAVLPPDRGVEYVFSREMYEALQAPGVYPLAPGVYPLGALLGFVQRGRRGERGSQLGGDGWAW